MSQACPVCVEPVGENTHFCPKCETPLTPFATTDPVHSIQAQGEMIRKGMKKPSLFILVGYWLLFGLPCAGFVFGLVVLLIDPDPRSGVAEKIMGTLAFFVFIALYFAIVRKVTQAYFDSRARATDSNHC